MQEAIITERNHHLVVPLAEAAGAPATDMRSTDTTGQLDLFGQVAGNDAARSGAVSPLIAAEHELRQGDVNSTNDRRTRPTTPMPGFRASTGATRTTITSRTRTGFAWSADDGTETGGASSSRRLGTSARQDFSRAVVSARYPHADFSFQDLVQAYLDCRRAKRNTAGALGFEQNQERELAALDDALRTGTYTPGRSTSFVITHPKPREVWAAPFADRVVHHLLYNKIAPRFHRAFIADSCACIPGRGTLYAARRLQDKVRSITQNGQRRAWYLKLDLANFFVSIDKNILHGELARRIPEPWWLALTEQILFHDPRENVDLRTPPRLAHAVPVYKRLANQPAHKGLPIGNLSSQFFANVYLDVLDQYVKHTLGVRHYIRYVDDFILLDESPARLNAHLQAITAFLPERLAVQLNPSKTILQPTRRGIDFVGQLITPWHRLPRRRTVHAMLARLASTPAEELSPRINSAFGTLRQATHSHHDRIALARLALRRGFSVDMKLTKTYPRSTRP